MRLRALVRSLKRAQSLRSLQAEIIEVNYQRPESLQIVIEGADAVVHLAGALLPRRGEALLDARLRLLRWAGISQPASSITQQGDFSLKGNLTLLPDGIALREGEGELFGSAFSGGFNYRGGENGEISLTLKSEQMDLAKLFGANGSKVTLWDFLAEKRVEDEEAPFSQSLAWLGKLHAKADISIGAISLPGLEDGALEANVALKEGVLDINRLLISSGRDINIQAAGRLTGLNSDPLGELTLAVQAGTRQGLSALGAFLNVPENILSSPEGLAAFVPVNVTAAIRSSDAEAKGLTTMLEGSVGKSDIKIKLDFAGAPANWTSGQFGIQGSITNASGKALLQQLRPQLKVSDLAGFEEGRGTLSLEANGVPESGLESKLGVCTRENIRIWKVQLAASESDPDKPD